MPSHPVEAYKMAGSASEDDTAAYLELALRVARGAGEIIKSVFDTPPGDYERKSTTDPVTETDRRVEAYCFAEIRKVCPAHKFIGEESAADADWTDEPTWIIDPIDGTANFVHRIPHCCTSIGLTINRKVIVGVVHNPILSETFTATHSGPALLNEKAITVSTVSDLSSACISREFGSDRTPAKTEMHMTNTRSLLANQVQCIRSIGSCALVMCYVACGRIDAYHEYGPYAWDMAAGALIVERAGGVVQDATGAPLLLTGRSLFVCNARIAPLVAELFIPVAKQG